MLAAVVGPITRLPVPASTGQKCRARQMLTHLSLEQNRDGIFSFSAVSTSSHGAFVLRECVLQAISFQLVIVFLFKTEIELTPTLRWPSLVPLCSHTRAELQ